MLKSLLVCNDMAYLMTIAEKVNGHWENVSPWVIDEIHVSYSRLQGVAKDSFEVPDINEVLRYLETWMEEDGENRYFYIHDVSPADCWGFDEYTEGDDD